MKEADSFQALILASQVQPTNASRSEHENHRDILSAVAGIIFLGTPHRGTNFSFWGQIKGLWGTMRSVSTHAELISILKADSVMITYLQEEFGSLCLDSRLSGLKLFCYYEMRELSLPPHIVVDQHSACLDYAASRGMNANHMYMNKFHDGPERDENYGHVLADILNIFQHSAKSISRRFENWRYGSDLPNFDRERLERWLDPSRKP